MKFDQHFSLYEIAKSLSAMRVKEASSRHRYQMYWSRLVLQDESGREMLPETKISSSLLDALLPPRRLWHRGNKAARKRQTSIGVAKQSILRTISGALNSDTLKDTKWGCHLYSFCEVITSKVERGEFEFSPPKLQFIRKDKGRIRTMDEDKKQHAYRCISTFDNLEDRIILGKTATYLRDIFDLEILDCSYAFRKDGRRFSFQTAVEKLIDYRRRFVGKTLYVADCDVQKFFDVINHQVVRDAYEAFVQRLGDRAPDERAGRILEAYLKVYQFPRILDDSQDPHVVELRNYVERVPRTVLEELYPGYDLSTLNLGIPQGGALSPLIANLVMDVVDRAVLSDEDEDLFYARFCDDIIIVHPNKQKCKEALRRYQEAMKLLKLPIHQLEKMPRYSAAYFKAKSKGPVAWKQTCVGSPGTPWVNFLGHQIRYDGVVRIRKETIQKHQERLKQEKSTLDRNLKKAKGVYRDGKNWETLYNVFLSRMLSMGVGRMDEGVDAPFSRSWVSIFRRNLDLHGPATVQMRLLDQTRTRVLSSVKSLLKKDWDKYNTTELLLGVRDDKRCEKTPRVRRKYFGAPFSYYGALKGLSRPTLEDVEIKEGDDIIGYEDL